MIDVPGDQARAGGRRSRRTAPRDWHRGGDPQRSLEPRRCSTSRSSIETSYRPPHLALVSAAPLIAVLTVATGVWPMACFVVLLFALHCRAALIAVAVIVVAWDRE